MESTRRKIWKLRIVQSYQLESLYLIKLNDSLEKSRSLGSRLVVLNNHEKRRTKYNLHKRTKITKEREWRHDTSMHKNAYVYEMI